MQPKETTRVSKYCIPGVTLTNKGDYWQIRKIGLTAKRVKNDPAFGKTRQQAKKFTQALRWAQKIAGVILPGTHIRQHPGRLAGVLVNLMPQGYPSANDVFKALVSQGNALPGFNFNKSASWKDVTTLPRRCEYIPQRRQWIFHLPVYKPPNSIQPPEGITHYRIRATAIAIGEQGSITAGPWVQTTLLPWKPVIVPQSRLEVDLEIGKEQVAMAFLHIQWYKPSLKSNHIVAARLPGVLTITGMYTWVDLS